MCCKIINLIHIYVIYSAYSNIPITDSFSLNNHRPFNKHSTSSLVNINRISSSSLSLVSERLDTTKTPNDEAEEMQKRDLIKMGEDLTTSLNTNMNDIYRDIKVRIAPSEDANTRLGLHAITKLKSKDSIALSIPYDDSTMFTPTLSKSCFKQYLSKDYDGWTGDAGLIAVMLLNEVARLSSNDNGIVRLPSRINNIQSFISTWAKSLPTIQEMKSDQYQHPLFWNEEDQELLQSSSTKKIFRLLDDIEEDYIWLEENIFSKDRNYFPEIVTNIIDESLEGDNKLRSHDCFNLQGFTWALSIVYSRSYFLDGTLRLLPILDYANHKEGCNELQGNAYMGTFKTIKGVQLKTSSSSELGEGDEVFISYGPKSSIEYLLEYGFLPFEQILQNLSNHNDDNDISIIKTSPLFRPYAMSQFTFEIDTDDRFYDDKLDILEEEAEIDTRQTFDIYEDTDGTPDPFMLQFLRLMKLSNTDAFLLESIFRKEVWDFMAYPVSEKNEEPVVDYVIEICNQYINELESMNGDDNDDTSTTLSNAEMVCAKIRSLELRALRATQEYMMRDREALDLKEYYQQRRLKDLGLDSDWNPDDEMDLGLGGSKRMPGDGGLDW